MNKEYLAYIDEELRPWLYQCVRDGYFYSHDDLRLHYYQAVHPEEKAAIVMVHGFCEFFGKYHETAYRFYQAGYSVFFLELRGHGKSERSHDAPDLRVHVDDFTEYTEDLHTFLLKVVIPRNRTGRLFLFGHSMGGAVSTLFLEQYTDMFRCAVLSSPMMMLDIKNLPNWILNALKIYPKVADKEQEYAPGQGPFTFVNEFEHSSCLDEDRYEYQFTLRCQDPCYQTWGSTWGWVAAAVSATEKLQKNAARIRTPILLAQAGNDNMVRNVGQDVFKSHCPYVTLLVYKDSRHELFNATAEIRDRYYRDVLDFYNAFL
jgi:lysophospholipase